MGGEALMKQMQTSPMIKPDFLYRILNDVPINFIHYPSHTIDTAFIFS